MQSSTLFSKRVTDNSFHTPKITPWVEKYRPHSVSEITAQEEAVLFMRNVLETGELPNTLFYGPPGTGKTSSILALVRDLFGSDQLKNRVLELNASDERGIQVIRERVKTFAQLTVAETHHKLTGKELPNFKLIILDEADNMTSSAQAALRRIMESCLISTRFCLICNYVTKIIDPILSRCSCFYFKPLLRSQCFSRLSYIRDKEQLLLSDSNLEFLINYSDGDLRKAIMYLQSCRYLQEKGISRENLLELLGLVSDDLSDRIFNSLSSGDVETITTLAKEFIGMGFSVSKFLLRLQEYMLTTDVVEESFKARVFLKLSDVDKMLADGADELLQLLYLLSFIVTSSNH